MYNEDITFRNSATLLLKAKSESEQKVTTSETCGVEKVLKYVFMKESRINEGYFAQ
jgi:hypothetical protein